MSSFDVIVIGAGHAGVEAAYSAARLGCHVGLCTLSRETVAHMPCNPAVGGTAKGHLVREIDALGGLMANAIDATGIQFKLLNRSRGPAVWSPRAQADKRLYAEWVAAKLDDEPNLTWMFGQVGALLVENSRVVGIAMQTGDTHLCTTLVMTTGTFLNGLVHVGREQRPAGRHGEPASSGLAQSIRSHGFEVGRLKTGTPPRLDRRSIDFAGCVQAGVFTEEAGDPAPVPFSFSTTRRLENRVRCWLLHTNDRVRALVTENIGQSPLYNGQISGIGPRYCPSLEDKIMRFPERERHHIYLEPEGLGVNEIYVNGFSMSLPREVQERLVHALPGLGDAVMLRPGYAVEYRFRSTDRTQVDTRNAPHPRAVFGRADQRHIWIRGSCCPGADCRRQRGACGPRRARVRPQPRRGVHRSSRGRSGHSRLPRAVPNVHVARRASLAASDRQRRSPSHAAGAKSRTDFKRAMGAL